MHPFQNGLAEFLFASFLKLIYLNDLIIADTLLMRHTTDTRVGLPCPKVSAISSVFPGGGSLFFPGPLRSRAVARQLKTAGFLDKQSKVVSIKFGSMHSASSLFSFVNIEFAMNAAGMYSDNSIEIQSVRLEPYVLRSNVNDRYLLACEVRCNMYTPFDFVRYFECCSTQINAFRFVSWFGSANFTWTSYGHYGLACAMKDWERV